MIFRSLLILSFFYSFSFSQESVSEFQKQKDEVIKLKQELTIFYNQKEKEYQEQKKELETLLSNIEKTKSEISKIKEDNLKLLNSITKGIQSKTSSIFNNIKPKIGASILNQMILDGKIEDVLDIILTLNEKKVTSIMKYMSVENSAELTLMLKNYSNKAK